MFSPASHAAWFMLFYLYSLLLHCIHEHLFPFRAFVFTRSCSLVVSNHVRMLSLSVINPLWHIAPDPSSSTPWQRYEQDPFNLWPHVLVQDPPRLQFRVEAPGPSAHCWALSLYFSFVFLFLFAVFSLLFILSRKLLCFWFLLYHLYSKNFAFFYCVASQTCNNFSTISTRSFAQIT